MDAIRIGILFLTAVVLSVSGLAITASGDDSGAIQKSRTGAQNSTASPAQEAAGTPLSTPGSVTSNRGLRLSRRFDLRWNPSAQDGMHAVTLAAGEIVEAAALDGSPTPKEQHVELRTDIRLQLPDESMLAKADRAIVTVRYQNATRTIVDSITIRLSGNVLWTFEETGVAADTLILSLQPSSKEKTAKARPTDWTLTGRARIIGKDFVAQGDRVELTRKSDEADRPMRVKLEGSAAIQYRENWLRASQIELCPSRHFVRVVNK